MKTIEQEILEALPYPKELTGLQITKAINKKRDQNGQPKWLWLGRVSMGTVHAALSHLKRQGLVEIRYEGDTFPRRGVWRKTTGGTKQLSELKAQEESLQNAPGLLNPV